VSTRTIQEEARQVEVIDEVEVLVVGGGPAGVCAAVGAARAGARTFLVENHGFLGGMWTAGMVLTLAGYNSWLRPYRRCVAGVPGEWLARAAALGGAEDHAGWVLNSDPEVMKLVADALLLETGVTRLYHTRAAAPIMAGSAVTGACIENSDGRRAILARVTVDCTGNGDLLARSGAPYDKSAKLQPMTLPFRMGGVTPNSRVDLTQPALIPIGPEAVLLQEPLLSEYASVRRDVACDRAAMQRAREQGRLPGFGGPWFGGLERDVVWVNATRISGDASVAAELTRAEIQGRRDAFALAGYFREHLPGFERARLVQTSTQIGIRETRRLIGEHVLTADEIRANSPCADSIAVGCWPIDVHPAEREVGVHAMYVPRPYGIPYRCLLPRRVEGLLAAGRCLSATREALGSVRVGATCAATGQAAGVAAALAARGNGQPRAVDCGQLKRTLAAQGAILEPLEAAEAE
jgi:hypothetical protein